ncbi:MAG: glycosyltransferase [Cyclobacteriaceae bacterium]|nr:glycosyltransferase [Cyclobacteriaceae bacterium]
MRKPVNVLVLTYWSLADALIQTYTLPYLRIIQKRLPPGSRLYLLTMEKSKSAVAQNPAAEALQQEGITWWPKRYYPFGFKAIMHWGVLVLGLLINIRRYRIHCIHGWATPAGSAGYVLSVLTGVRLVIDSYEPHAEAMVENGTWKKNSLAFQLLFALEKRQTKRATHLIAAHAGMLDYARLTYGVELNNLLVKPACVDLNLFHFWNEQDHRLMMELGLEGKIVAIYAGKFGGIYLDREVFDFLKAAHEFWGERFRTLVLTSHQEEEIASFCKRSNLSRHVVITRFVPHREVPRYLSLADFALTPVKPVPTKRYCTPIKDGEYWAMGLPVVIPDGISEDSEIIRAENAGVVLRELNAEAYRSALTELEVLMAEPRAELRNRIRALAVKHRNFSIAEKVYDVVYGQ